MLFQLGGGESIRHLLEATAGAAQPLDVGRQLALAGAAVLVDARQADGWQVDPRFVPLGICKVVEGLDNFTLVTRRAGRAGLSVVDPVDLFASERLQQQLGALGRAPLKEPKRERPQDEDISAAPASGKRDNIFDPAPS